MWALSLVRLLNVVKCNWSLLCQQLSTYLKDVIVYSSKNAVCTLLFFAKWRVTCAFICKINVKGLKDGCKNCSLWSIHRLLQVPIGKYTLQQWHIKQDYNVIVFIKFCNEFKLQYEGKVYTSKVDGAHVRLNIHLRIKNSLFHFFLWMSHFGLSFCLPVCFINNLFLKCLYIFCT